MIWYKAAFLAVGFVGASIVIIITLCHLFTCMIQFNQHLKESERDD